MNYQARFSGRQILIILLLLVFLLAGCGRSNNSGTGAPPTSSPSPPMVRVSTDVVKISTAEVDIGANGSAEATVKVSVTPGFHVNANPPSFPYLIPISVEQHANQVGCIAMGKPSYPQATIRKFAFSKEPIAVYEGDVPIKLPLRAKCNASIEQPVLLTVRVQACDDEKCYPPATADFTIGANVK